MKNILLITTAIGSIMIGIAPSATFANEGLSGFELQRTNQNRTLASPSERSGDSRVNTLGDSPVVPLKGSSSSARKCIDSKGKKLTLGPVIRSFCLEMIARSGTLKGGHRYGKWGIEEIMVKAK